MVVELEGNENGDKDKVIKNSMRVSGDENVKCQ